MVLRGHEMHVHVQVCRVGGHLCARKEGEGAALAQALSPIVRGAHTLTGHMSLPHFQLPLPAWGPHQGASTGGVRRMAAAECGAGAHQRRGRAFRAPVDTGGTGWAGVRGEGLPVSWGGGGEGEGTGIPRVCIRGCPAGGGGHGVHCLTLIAMEQWEAPHPPPLLTAQFSGLSPSPLLSFIKHAPGLLPPPLLPFVMPLTSPPLP